MTDQIRKRAEAALSKWMEPNPIRIGTENRCELFIQGYLAAHRDLGAESRSTKSAPLSREERDNFEDLIRNEED